MNCPRCNTELKVVFDEVMGEVKVCVSCGVEVSIPYDHRPNSMDRIPKTNE